MALKDKTIRTQILLFVGLISGIALAIVISVAIGLFAGIGATTKNLVQSKLEDIANSNLLNSSKGLGDVLSRRLQKFEEATNVIAQGTQYFLDQSKIQPLGPIPSYYWYDATTAPPGTIFNASYGYDVNLQTSVYLITNSDITTYQQMILANPSINYTITQSAHLDSFFPPLLNDGDVAQLQVGIPGANIYRRFPGTDQFIARSYDFTTRPWYKTALAANGKIGYVPPYVGSATGQWSIAVSTTVSVAGNLVAVTAAEIRLTNLQSLVASQRPLGQGTASLIINDTVGTIISDPSWNFNAALATGQTANLSYNNPQLFSQLQPFDVPRVVTPVTINGVDYTVTQVPIHGPYVVLYVVPKSAVLSTVNQISNKIDTFSNTIIGITVGVGVITLIFVLFISTSVAVQITRPVEVLSRVALQIASNATNANKMDNVKFNDGDAFAQRDEIGELTDAFKDMIAKLTGSNRPKSMSRGSFPADVNNNINTAAL